MEPLDPYIEQCRRMSVGEFAKLHPYPFLIVHAGEDEDERVRGFRTTTISQSKIEQLAAGEERPYDLFRVMRVTKSADNPWRNRISVGRARNNDLVIRDKSISKLHAHFAVNDDGSVLLVDAGSRNGTRINSDKLAPGEGRPMRASSEITFGSVEALYEDATGLYRFVSSMLRG